MGQLFKKFKTKFRYALKPVFAMLVARRGQIDHNEWILMVTKMRESVYVNAPEFLGHELPEQMLLRDVLDEIFQEFLKERAYHDATSGQKMINRIFK